MPSQISGPPQTHYYPNQLPPSSGPPQDPSQGNYYSSGPPTSGPPEGLHGGELAPLAPGVQPAAEHPAGRSMILDGRKYELFVVQQPQRARMCGFGDKDRRPITPPPCVKLVITDVASGKEVDCNDVDHGMFVISTDLWHENGRDEVNMVRHSNTSPSISSTTPVSFQDITMTPAYSNIMPQSNVFKAESGQGGQPASYNPYPGPPQVNAYAAPQGGSQSYYSNNYPPATNGAAYPPQNGYSQPSGASSYYPTAAGSGSMDYPSQGQQAYGSGGPRTFSPHEMPVARGPINNSAPQGMFTRNLIGSLAASAFRLCDPDDRIGIWFVLQDLSIRTEGHFRLRFSFVNVGVPVSPSNPGAATTLTTNKTVAPVLASCFSDVFHVYSAKRFPGVVESTNLSKCFATQGIKIPIRKEGPGKNDKEKDYEEE
ncbi:velvet factor-domain-containing protein [Rhexocercosporidium sp. MPI-PUGE-AT-0058]|nr:velvet factor-domain-containing protein [Rhexocercosporidium sp. MPI-PUGE-AT-0058]